MVRRNTQWHSGTLARVYAGLLQRDTQVVDDGVGDVVGGTQEEDDMRYDEVAKAMGKLKNL